ncbi:hypothetical protein SORBI_3009G085300 [Sorghum bicolor]|uniref:Uncharacterized protein n=1 Tax=Sorghum bicolor TaxID=4558 RepID=A0A1Z5R1K6_SORBI|nr:hypothetical protein SORBI_3009G085300 [Sorghum bicolor]
MHLSPRSHNHVDFSPTPRVFCSQTKAHRHTLPAFASNLRRCGHDATPLGAPLLRPATSPRRSGAFSTFLRWRIPTFPAMRRPLHLPGSQSSTSARRLRPHGRGGFASPTRGGCRSRQRYGSPCPFPEPAARGFPSWSGGRATHPAPCICPHGGARSSCGSGPAPVVSSAVTVSREKRYLRFGQSCSFECITNHILVSSPYRQAVTVHFFSM